MNTPKREELSTNTWFPISKELTHRCCKCGAKHVFKFKVETELRMMVKTAKHQGGCLLVLLAVVILFGLGLLAGHYVVMAIRSADESVGNSGLATNIARVPSLRSDLRSIGKSEILEFSEDLISWSNAAYQPPLSSSTTSRFYRLRYE